MTSKADNNILSAFLRGNYFMNDFDTVAAISTARSTGGISVIRISGDDAFNVADKIFTPVSHKKKPSEMDGYTCEYGYYTDSENNRIDDGILTVFKAPHSYTGENVVEVSCHGGIFVTEKLLNRIYECGASPAGAGEFTKRAFLNGKLSLSEAEAVMDIISASGEQYFRYAESLKNGSLYRKTEAVSDELVHILGQIGAWVDYPEEDIPEIESDTLCLSLEEILKKLDKTRNTYSYGKILREGVETVICGKPNVGKSTLMNLLTGYERSIVTDTEGTTRDIVEESVRMNNIVLRISDTAGIRKTDDKIEKIGVEKSKNKLKEASLVIAVFDNSREYDENDLEIINFCKGRKALAVINKSDKENKLDKNIVFNNFEYYVEISAKNIDSIGIIQKVLDDIFIDNSINDELIIVNDRQKQCIDNAYRCIDEAVKAIKFGDTLDAVNIILDEAEGYLLELEGKKTTDTVVNEVFSHFCVGK